MVIAVFTGAFKTYISYIVTSHGLINGAPFVILMVINQLLYISVVAKHHSVIFKNTAHRGYGIQIINDARVKHFNLDDE